MSFVGVLVALVIGELAVRLYQRQPLLPLVPPEPYIDNAILYRPSPTRLYELRPGAGLYRVGVLGDSFTFGGKVPLERMFSPSLERALAASDRSRRYEVVNLAVPGYNSEQEMWSLKEAGLAYHPDLVIVNFVLNDAGRMMQLIPHDSSLPVWLRRVLKRSTSCSSSTRA